MDNGDVYNTAGQQVARITADGVILQRGQAIGRIRGGQIFDTVGSSGFTMGPLVGRVATNVLNVRGGAGTEYSAISQLLRNVEVRVLRVDGAWFEIEVPNGPTGWVSAPLMILSISVLPSDDKVADNDEQTQGTVDEMLRRLKVALNNLPQDAPPSLAGYRSDYSQEAAGRPPSDTRVQSFSSLQIAVTRGQCSVSIDGARSIALPTQSPVFLTHGVHHFQFVCPSLDFSSWSSTYKLAPGNQRILEEVRR